jgi:tuberculosinol/isotuberculosinol synthase
MMSQEDFFNRPTSDIAEFIREQGPKVCVFPVNGTRRWFLLEKSTDSSKDCAKRLVQTTGKAIRRLVKLLFDHGIDTVLTPVYGRELVTERGSEYRNLAKKGLRLLTEGGFQEFYDASGIQVHFYGDYEREFKDDSALLEKLSKVENRTASQTNHRLFYGVCGESAVRTITSHAAELGRPLSHQEAIEVFYGEPIALADLFIGFDAPTAFDMPLLDKGGVDLYFTLSPSPYIDQLELRAILYDWIFVRHKEEADYNTLNTHKMDSMRRYYRANRHNVMGLGIRQYGIWYSKNNLCDY